MCPIFELNPDKTLGQCVAMEYIAVERTHEHGTVYVCARRTITPCIQHNGIYDRALDVVYFPTRSHVDEATWVEATWVSHTESQEEGEHEICPDCHYQNRYCQCGREENN
jgi:hypothetical protein